MKEVLVLRDLDCIKAIAHPRRVDILKTFDKDPLSAKQLSEILDEPHAKINYHIKTLYNVGILELVEENIKSGIVWKLYCIKFFIFHSSFYSFQTMASYSYIFNFTFFLSF